MKIKNKRFFSGSALTLSMVMMASLFIIAFFSAHIVITSISQENKIINNLRAEQAIRAGVEELRYEVYRGSIIIDNLNNSDDLVSREYGDYQYSVRSWYEDGEWWMYITGSYKDYDLTKIIRISDILKKDNSTEDVEYPGGEEEP